MKRLEEVQLPEWTRVMWGSIDIRNKWESKIDIYRNAFDNLELNSVKNGLRKATLAFYSPSTLAEKTVEFIKDGITVLPVEKIKTFDSTYQASSIPAGPDDTDIVLRCFICKLEDAEEVNRAWELGDYEIGRILGYPDCCRKFFQSVWVDQNFLDTSWKMAEKTDDSEDVSVKEFENIDPRNNILWRWMGVRASSHLPCSFECEATRQIGEKNLSLLPKEAKDIGLEILSWPVEWSALHGIAEIKTPILKVSTRTDVTPITYTIRLKSDKYPEGGISGVKFPFQNSANKPYTQQVSFRSVEFESKDWYYQDNAFGSLETMNTYQKPILTIMRRNLVLYNNVVDLGCGNGALLYKLKRLQDKIIPYGCDFDKYNVIKHSKIIHPEFSNNFQQMDIATYVSFLNNIPGVMFDLCLLTPARISEYDQAGKSDEADAIRYFIKNKCKHVIMYCYGDNLAPSETGGVPWESLRLEAVEGSLKVAKVDGYEVLDHEDNSSTQSGEGYPNEQPFITAATLVKFNANS